LLCFTFCICPNYFLENIIIDESVFVEKLFSAEKEFEE